MGLLWTLEQKIKVESKCFANLTGVNGTISHYLLRSNHNIVRGAFYSKLLHVAYHGILDELGSFVPSKISDNFLPPSADPRADCA